MVYQSNFLFVLLFFLLPSLSFFFLPSDIGALIHFVCPRILRKDMGCLPVFFPALFPWDKISHLKLAVEARLTDLSQQAPSLHLVLTSNSGYKFKNMLVLAWLFENLSIDYKKDFGLHAYTVSFLMHWTIFSAFYAFPSAEICLQPLTHFLSWAKSRR